MATVTTTALVYGDTVAAVFAACAIADLNVDVALVTPMPHLGTPLRTGLGATDIGRRGTRGIGYLSEEYFRVFTMHSGLLSGTQYRAAPSLVDQTVRHMLAKRVHQLTVFAGSGYALASVAKSGTVVTSVTTTDGTVFALSLWQDTSEDGELGRLAGLTMVKGREARDVYGEPLAGFSPAFSTFQAVDTRDGAGNLLFGVEPYPSLSPGDPDSRTQAYTFRIAATDDPTYRLRWPKPFNYDPTLFELERRLARPDLNAGFRPARKAFVGDGVMDFNGDWGRPVQSGWPGASAAAKQAIKDTIYAHQYGWFWFLANDASVKDDVRGWATRVGPVRGEFTDTTLTYSAGVPYQLYTRVASRMVGRYVMRQSDCQGAGVTKSDGLACGFYSFDHHAVARYEVTQGSQRGVILDGFGNLNETEDLQTAPYQIPSGARCRRRANAPTGSSRSPARRATSP